VKQYLTILIKEYLKLLNRLYDITWLGAVHYTYEKHKLFHIRVITKLPNSEQSYKGKVKTHKYINRQNQSTTENCENRNDPDLVQAFLKKWWA
jgi:hypothetical protein